MTIKVTFTPDHALDAPGITIRDPSGPNILIRKSAPPRVLMHELIHATTTIYGASLEPEDEEFLLAKLDPFFAMIERKIP